jgi:hypothetical protein
LLGCVPWGASCCWLVYFSFAPNVCTHIRAEVGQRILLQLQCSISQSHSFSRSFQAQCGASVHERGVGDGDGRLHVRRGRLCEGDCARAPSLTETGERRVLPRLLSTSESSRNCTSTTQLERTF